MAMVRVSKLLWSNINPNPNSNSALTLINNNNILYLDTLSKEETLFKGVYIGTIIGYTN